MLNKAAGSFILKTRAQEVALLYLVALGRLKKAGPVLPASTRLLSIPPWQLKLSKATLAKTSDFSVVFGRDVGHNSAFSRQRDVKARASGAPKKRSDF